MGDRSLEKLARLLVDYSVDIQPGEKVSIEGTTLAEPLMTEIYRRVLERGGFPHLLFDLPDQNELFYRYAGDQQLEYIPVFHRLAVDTFDARIRVLSDGNTRALGKVDPQKIAKRQKSLAPMLQSQMKRGGDGSLKWVGTLYPIRSYAFEANMATEAYRDFVYKACHVDDATEDPVAYWKSTQAAQAGIVERLKGHDLVQLRGPNADLTLSIKGRTFMNSCGKHNMPDGEVYTGPVEDSASGWVRFTYPAIYSGRIVEGIELHFEHGRVEKASARKEEELLLKMIDSDARSRYLGEFAFGTNMEIDQFTSNILFDEKIGGTFHLALGSGYPETGSLNKSVIHWDMICDLRTDSEILVDGEVIYRNGQFIF